MKKNSRCRGDGHAERYGYRSRNRCGGGISVGFSRSGECGVGVFFRRHENAGGKIYRTTGMNIVQQEDVPKLDEVVVTGIFKKARESYTGAVSTIGKEEILAYRGQNMLQTLRNIDPAFNVVQNNEFGSDPNRLPDITVRGVRR